MKRRAISFLIALALCLSLCPMRTLAAGEDIERVRHVTGDTTISTICIVTESTWIDTHGYIYTVENHPAVSVQNNAKVYLTQGTIKSTKGTGIELQAGCFLYVDDPDMTVIGATYGLDLASGATAELSSGTFTGKTAAIRAEDGNYGALLKTGCAFYDENGEPIALKDVADKTTVVIKECAGHLYEYTPNTGTTHNGVCAYCGGTVNSEMCTFNFNADGSAKCVKCDHTIKITITKPSGDQVYNGESQPDDVIVKVVLDNGEANSQELAEGTNYTVSHTPRTNAGEIILVTVAGESYNGSFTKTFNVVKDAPVITWDAGQSDPTVDYEVDQAALTTKVKAALLSRVIITIKSNENLSGTLQFSFKEKDASDDSFTNGLPTDAGTYQIKASLPEQTNYEAASSGPITLTINKINPFINNDVPNAIEGLIYNATARKLVTPGTVWDGAVVLFALGGEDSEPDASEYSESIPTGIDADEYFVWYKVEETNNYDKVAAEHPIRVTITPKEITPIVELDRTSYPYDGGEIQPQVTVRDPDTWAVLPSSEYTVTYSNNISVGGPKDEDAASDETGTDDEKDKFPTVTVTNKEGGNYRITQTSVYFRITAADQAGLTITGQRSNISYGDEFTLGTTGGSGNGTVTWKITTAKDSSGNEVDSETIAVIDPDSGQVTVTGVGTVTVQATKSDADSDGNHKDATATWTFTSGKRHVTAIVTADNKTYDDTDTATVHAIVAEQDIVFDDTIEITVTGTFSDKDAGTGKTVTVDTAGAQIKIDGNQITGTENGKYIIAFSSTTVTADIYKAETEIKTPPTPKELTYNETKQALLSSGAAASTTTGVSVAVEYALSKDGPYSTNFASLTAADAGDYEVWYRVRESTNYTGIPADMVVVTIAPKSVTPVVTLSQSTYTYDGSEKKPTVTVKESETAETPIPDSEYTVAYTNNVNVGTATVTVTAKADGNYTFSPVEKHFTITREEKATLTSSPQAVANLIYNGQAQNLVTVGTASGGHLEYALEITNVDGTTAEGTYSTAIPKGTAAGEYKVYYKVVGDSNHTDTEPDYVFVTISPKTVVSPVITLTGESGDKPYSVEYDGDPQTPGVASVVDDGEIIPATEYTVTYSNNVNAGTATIHIVDKNGGNYTVNGSTTFEITKAKAEFTTDPADVSGLTYNGKAQALITAGVAKGGTAVYSLNDVNGPYSAAIPTGTDRDEYTVYAKVRGDANHEDSAVKTIEVTIGVNEVADPTVELSSTSFQYNGSEQRPTVTVKDDKGNVIPANEYIVTYEKVTVSTEPEPDPIEPEATESEPVEIKDVGTYKITITSKTGGNYSFTPLERTFIITAADQTALAITGKPSIVYYGDTIQLGTTGGSGNGAVTWSIEDGNDAVEEGESAGQFVITGTGKITIKATRTSNTDNYATAEDTWEFYAYPKPVIAVVTAANKVYDGNRDAKLSVTVPGTAIKITFQDDDFKGTFDTADVGTNKTVEFTITEDDVNVTGNEKGNYAITFPGESTATASITPASTSLSGITVTKIENLTYSGVPQELITVTYSDGVTVAGGDLAYSLDGRNYDLNIPTGLNAGTYIVRYKVLADSNHKDSEVVTVTVTIKQATPSIDSTNLTATPITSEQTLKDSVLSGGRAICDGVEVPGTFTWTNGDTKLSAGRIQQEVTFTPADRINFLTATTMVEVTVIYEAPSTDNAGDDNGTDTTPSSPPTNPGAENASTQTTVRDGTASTVVSAAAGNELVNKAVANHSDTVIIKPEITGDVTKAEVSLPASTVGRIGNETDASLTVSTPIADVTIPNGALDALSNAGGTVSVVTEQVDNTIVLSLTANGRDVGTLPGGLTLTVPMEDASPGTVAVLVYEDGTRETIRKSVAEDGGVRIPLNGSATVEIVDNSKEFADVSPENWAADAVAFASAHEMFNGTSETTFSPEKAMSRAMLATVLYNLEGQPDQNLTGAFSDIDSDTWYAESVSWAAANGITGGYGGGQFGPNDSITREQLAVMLWRYAGSPAAGEQALDFTDADQASGYAAEALCWAVENGILNGYGNGRIDPTGLATRAQAAQMLKNFMENT